MSGDTVSVIVPVSGTCSRCGQINHASIPTSAPRGSTAHAVATGICGDASCGGSITMTGSAVAS
jgi:hypothetical protein